MLDTIKDFFRRRKERKCARERKAGFKSVSEMKNAAAIILVNDIQEETETEKILKSWCSHHGIKLTPIYIAPQTRKKELPLKYSNGIICKDDISLAGIPSDESVRDMLEKAPDILISAVPGSCYAADFIARCSPAGFKAGIYYDENNFLDMTVIVGKGKTEEEALKFLLESIYKINH